MYQQVCIVQHLDIRLVNEDFDSISMISLISILGTIHLLYKNDPQCCFNYQSVETQFANPVRRLIVRLIFDWWFSLAKWSKSWRFKWSDVIDIKCTNTNNTIETPVRYAETMDETNRSVIEHFHLQIFIFLLFNFEGQHLKFPVNFSITSVYFKVLHVSKTLQLVVLINGPIHLILIL